jgi:hypothetical protein
MNESSGQKNRADDGNHTRKFREFLLFRVTIREVREMLVLDVQLRLWTTFGAAVEREILDLEDTPKPFNFENRQNS